MSEILILGRLSRAYVLKNIMRLSKDCAVDITIRDHNGGLAVRVKGKEAVIFKTRLEIWIKTNTRGKV